MSPSWLWSNQVINHSRCWCGLDNSRTPAGRMAVACLDPGVVPLLRFGGHLHRALASRSHVRVWLRAPADGGELNVNLQKMKKADTWPAALQGRNTQVDPMTLEGMQKKIMLERFQSEVRVQYIDQAHPAAVQQIDAAADCMSWVDTLVFVLVQQSLAPKQPAASFNRAPERDSYLVVQTRIFSMAFKISTKGKRPSSDHSAPWHLRECPGSPPVSRCPLFSDPRTLTARCRCTLHSFLPTRLCLLFLTQNPGFDFSGAEFNGQVPDARSFMGGVKYT